MRVCDLSHNRTNSPLVILALVQSGQLDWVEQFLDLLFGQYMFLANNLEDSLPALVGFTGQLSCLFVTHHWIQRCDNSYRCFEIVFEHLLVYGDAIYAARAEGAGGAVEQGL